VFALMPEQLLNAPSMVTRCARNQGQTKPRFVRNKGAIQASFTTSMSSVSDAGGGGVSLISIPCFFLKGDASFGRLLREAG
jgi:hypothetical protein